MNATYAVAIERMEQEKAQHIAEIRKLDAAIASLKNLNGGSTHHMTKGTIPAHQAITKLLEQTNEPMNLHDIWVGIRLMGSDVQQQSIATACSKLAAEGILERVGEGLYKSLKRELVTNGTN